MRNPGGGDEAMFGEGLLASGVENLPPDELRRTIHHLQIEIRALREALERTARHAHDADPSTSHVAEFARCPHPVCRQARAMLPEGREPAPAAEGLPSLETPERRPRLRSDGDPSDPERRGLADAGGADREDADEVEPSWIPLDRSPAPPPRRPARSPAERPAAAEAPPRARPAASVPSAPPVQAPAAARPMPAQRPAAEGPSPEPRIDPAPPAAPERPAVEEPPPVVRQPVAEAGERPRPWMTPMPPPPSQGGSTDERTMPSHIFDQPPAGPRPQEPPGEAEPDAEPDPITGSEPETDGEEEARPPYPPAQRHAPPDKDAGIADAAADAIDRLARTLFGPKRRR